MKTGFSLWELAHMEFPVSPTGYGFADSFELQFHTGWNREQSVCSLVITWYVPWIMIMINNVSMYLQLQSCSYYVYASPSLSWMVLGGWWCTYK
jgi:hypothetical protein